MKMAKVLGKPLKLSDMPRRTAETQRVNNPHSVTAISQSIFDLSQELSREKLDKIVVLMDEELGSDLAAPVKAD